MLDPTDETLIALADVPAMLPRRRGGKKAHISGIYRWTKSGLRGHVLWSTQCGGTRVTSAAALYRFFTALATAGPTPHPTSTSRQKQRAIERADRECESAGA